MNTSTVIQSDVTDKGSKAAEIRHPNPLLSVAGWELRRMYVSRAGWVMAGLVFLLFALLVFSQQRAHDLTFGWGSGSSAGYDPNNMIHVTITGTSGWGMVQTVPRLLLLVLGLFIPFVTADLVARDLKSRTHGVIMAAPVPTWAYVWGRYMAGLVLSLALAFLMLGATVVVGVLFQVVRGDPPPSFTPIVLIWVVAVLPAIVFLSGVSFTLGTLLPRHANFVKIAVLTGWFLSSLTLLFAGGGATEGGSKYISWDPTATAMSLDVEAQYNGRFGEMLDFRGATQPVTEAVRERATNIARQVEGEIPDVWPWVLPRLEYAGLGILAVVLAAVRFQRFRNL